MKQRKNFSVVGAKHCLRSTHTKQLFTVHREIHIKLGVLDIFTYRIWQPYLISVPEQLPRNISFHIFISVQSISTQPKIYFPFSHRRFFSLLAKGCCTHFFFPWASPPNVSKNKLIILSLKQDNALPPNFLIYVKGAALGFSVASDRNSIGPDVVKWQFMASRDGPAWRAKAIGHQGRWSRGLSCISISSHPCISTPSHPCPPCRMASFLLGLQGSHTGSLGLTVALPLHSMALAQVTEPFWASISSSITPILSPVL